MKNLDIISTLLCYPVENKFIALYNNLTIKEDINKFPDIIFYFDNSDCFGEYNKKTSRFFYAWYSAKVKLELNSLFNEKLIIFILDFLVEKYFNLDTSLCPYSNYDHSYIEYYFKHS